VAGCYRLTVRHEAGLEALEALIAIEKGFHGANLPIEAIYEGEDEWFAYGDISYPDPPTPEALREIPLKVVLLENRKRRQSSQTRR
jgi:hypothetical protein